MLSLKPGRILAGMLVAGCVVGNLAAAPAGQQPSAASHRQAAKTFSSGDTTRLQYLLYLPKEYQARPGQKWPIILFLHGAGERGTNIYLVAKHGPPKLVEAGRDFPFIIVSPQCAPNKRWEVGALSALLDDIEKTYRVDKTREYLTGLSMGGFGTWSLGMHSPARFAAIAPICGGGDPATIEQAEGEKAAAIKSLGIWVFHGEKDPTVPIASSERMVNALKKLGCADVTFTRYPEAQHDSWTVTYDNPKLYDWFLAHRRS